MYFSNSSANTLHWKDSNLSTLLPQVEYALLSKYDYSGPYYVYNADILQERCERLEKSLPNAFFYYSVKSLSNINILKLILKFEKFGMDIVSEGELARALKAGCDPRRIVFAGVAKTDKEISKALDAGIRSFHVESAAELHAIERICEHAGKTASVALRINPDVEVVTHKYITTGKDENKFGISLRELPSILPVLTASTRLKLRGLQSHIGSQLLDAVPYMNALDALLKVAKEFDTVEYISLGGGFGVDYNSVYDGDKTDDFPLAKLSQLLGGRNDIPCELHFEPGRYISAPAGILVSKVRFIKPKVNYDIALVDAGMTDLIRPALYSAEHRIIPLKTNGKQTAPAEKREFEIAGPICESADVFGRFEFDRLKENDTILFTYAGAYGAVMGSNYNSRPLIPEVCIGGDQFTIIRKPQLMEDILQYEEV